MRFTRPALSGSHGRSASVVAVLVVAAVAAAALLILRPWADDDEETGSPPTTEPAPDTTTEPPEPVAPPHVPTLSGPAPIGPRANAAVVWTGTELVVWGGIDSVGPSDQPVTVLDDGAAFDPTAGTWRMLPEWPFATTPEQLPDDIIEPVAVATEAGVVVVDAGATALWGLDGDSWQVMDPGPIRVGTLVANEDEVFSAQANARLDLTTGQWRALPEPPIALVDTVSAWTGDELVVAGFIEFTALAAQAFDPTTGTWRALPEPPAGFSLLGSGSALGGGWDGDRLVLVNGSSYQVFAFDPSADDWEELPQILPPRLQFSPVPVERAGDEPMVFLNESMTVLDEDLWRPVPYGWLEGDSITGFWRLDAVRGPGESTVLIPVVDPATEELMAYSMDVLAALAQRVVPIGPITLEIPDRWSVVRILETVGVERQLVDFEQGNDTCSVIAGVEDESFVLQPIGPDVTVDHDGDERVWQVHPTGTNWQHDAGDYVVVISCGDPADSEAFANGVRFDDGP